MVPSQFSKQDKPWEPESSPPRPLLPPPPGYLYAGTPRATVHFLVHTGMAELRRYALERGWPSRGWTQLTTPWMELHYTTDGWKTTRVLKSTDVPCPVVNGYFYLPYVEKNQEVEFAVQVGLACRAEGDSAGERETGAVWFNNDGLNYRQRAR